MAELLTNPLAELEGVYLDGDWDRAFRRAASSRGTLDLLRIALVLAADLRAIRDALQTQARGSKK